MKDLMDNLTFEVCETAAALTLVCVRWQSAEAQLPVLGAGADGGPDDDDEAYDDKITQDHLRLLFLVSLYSKPAENDEEVCSFFVCTPSLCLLLDDHGDLNDGGTAHGHRW